MYTSCSLTDSQSTLSEIKTGATAKARISVEQMTFRIISNEMIIF